MINLISVECERVVLGYLMLNKERRSQAMAEVSVVDFGYKPHAVIYTTMRSLPPEWDSALLRERLRADERIDFVGGADYLLSLVDGLPKEINLAPHLERLRECRMRREIADQASKMRSLCEDGDGDIWGQAKALIDAVSPMGKDGAPHIAEIADHVVSSLEEAQRSGGRPAGLPTGLSFLDNYIGGIPYRSLVVIAGRPSVGKSSFGMNLSLRAAEAGYKVGIISLEESAEALITRMLSALARVNGMSIQVGRLSREEWARFMEAKAKLSQLHIWCDDETSLIGKIQAKAHQLRERNELDVLMVDYLQIIHGERRESRNIQVGEWTGIFKRLSKELKCTIFLISQLSRAAVSERRKPRLDDLRDSGSIEQDADMVIFLHRPHQTEEPLSSEAPRPIELIVAKNRHGPTRAFSNDVAFIPAFTLFETI